jgi:hypothetical protein
MRSPHAASLPPVRARRWDGGGAGTVRQPAPLLFALPLCSRCLSRIGDHRRAPDSERERVCPYSTHTNTHTHTADDLGVALLVNPLAHASSAPIKPARLPLARRCYQSMRSSSSLTKRAARLSAVPLTSSGAAASEVRRSLLRVCVGQFWRQSIWFISRPIRRPGRRRRAALALTKSRPRAGAADLRPPSRAGCSQKDLAPRRRPVVGAGRAAFERTTRANEVVAILSRPPGQAGARPSAWRIRACWLMRPKLVARRGNRLAGRCWRGARLSPKESAGGGADAIRAAPIPRSLSLKSAQTTWSRSVYLAAALSRDSRPVSRGRRPSAGVRAWQRRR